MPRSSRKTTELARRFKLTSTKAVDVLTKAGIKPIRTISTPTGRARHEWPTRISIQTLRSFREEHPARGSRRKAAKVRSVDPTAGVTTQGDVFAELKALRRQVSDLAKSVKQVLVVR